MDAKIAVLSVVRHLRGDSTDRIPRMGLFSTFEASFYPDVAIIEGVIVSQHSLHTHDLTNISLTDELES